MGFAKNVSVPLRGLDIQKQRRNLLNLFQSDVSVPLRGLDIQKQEEKTRKTQTQQGSFSPLAGIRYSETENQKQEQQKKPRVSVPLRGLDIQKH